MAAARQLRLGAFMRPASIHTGAWRYPDAWPDMNFNFAHIKQSIQALERRSSMRSSWPTIWPCSTCRWMRSSAAILLPRSSRSRVVGAVASHRAHRAGRHRLDDLRRALSIARRFASLDWISGGRAGWNIVTTSNPDAALNFGLDEHMEHGERYRRAREFYDVVTGLWDSWADDAWVRNVEDGVFFDPAKMHVLNHKGKYFSVRGPVNIARPIQGWPVIVQAGASDSGRQLAAETAEAVFTAQSDLAVGQKFYANVKGRMEKLGRSRDHMKILPACFVVVGDTVEEAKGKRAKLDSLVNYANAIASLSIALGHDASKFDPDAPLPEKIPESNASKSGRERAIAMGKRDNLTVRQLAQRLGGYSGLAMVGTPATIADEMEEWLETEGSDGFTIMFPYLPGGLEDFVNQVIPELQRRNLFRREYEGERCGRI